MKRFVMHTLAAACLAAAVGPVFANANSSVGLNNLVITVAALNPTDGSTPSLTFDPITSYERIENSSYGDPYQGTIINRYSTPQQSLLAYQVNGDWSSSGASILRANNAAGFSAVSAQGVAGSGLDGYGSFHVAADVNQYLTSFTLSAHSEVTFTVDAAMQTKTTMGYNLDADQGEYAYTHAVLNVFGQIGDVYENDLDEHMLDSTYYVRDDNTTTGVSDSWNGKLSITYVNWGSTATTAQLQTYVVADGQSATWDGVTPVPEPETYAMMLGGLALIGVLGRRSRRRAAKA
ncbi:PEP-CTERM sorting domain-containing protein [Rugamonas sp.]|uniref:PEP-CTERM sorting domain-containing protein n=1 Tax=Rugamonas sp. TaxID=1926287 RepID=UPI0025F29790|nr:PEP-CTERM sorting domain-containing protein [Rugamonas sp.]